ncbi:MAG: DUF7024 domain-containing protein [Telluria sp.]
MSASAWGVALGSFAVFLWLGFRAQGLYPSVFADEWYYSSFARLTPPGEATVPSYLYYAVYGALSHAAGPHFLDAVRWLNAACFAAAAPFLYATARRYAPAPLALTAALLAILAPLNLFTAFFMPESPYFLGFAGLTWLALARGRWHWLAHGLACGAVLGLMALVKVHAMFLLPSLMLFLGAARRREGLVAIAGSALAAAVACMGMRFGLGIALAGPAAANLFGSFYGNPTQGPLHDLASVLRLLGPALIGIKGHLAGLALLAALPLALITLSLVSARERAAQPAEVTDLRLFTLLMLGAAVALSVFYTASLAYAGPGEYMRLHSRYYDFAMPLLILCGAAELAGAAVERTGLGRALALALPVLGLAVACVWLKDYLIHATDSPEYAVLPMDHWPGRLAAVAAALSLVLWARRRQDGAAFYLFISVPLVAALGMFGAERIVTEAARPSAYDRAGAAAHARIPAAERDSTLIVGGTLADALRSQFQLDGRKADTLILEEGSPVSPHQLPWNRKWMLVIGRHALPPGLEIALRDPAFTLVHLGGDYHALAADDMGRALPGSLVAGVDGFAPAEPWGRWSVRKTVVLHFARPLPKTVNLLLTVHAFGPNVGLPFRLRAGNEEREFFAGPAPHEVFVSFPTDGNTRDVSIEVPQPTVPDGLPPEAAATRALGLGLSKVELGSGAALH